MTREPFWPWDEGYDDVPDEERRPKTCTRCGDTSASFCEDWDCHKGWA